MWTLPASSVRSEEIFSTAGNILTLKNNQHVNMLLHAKSGHDYQTILSICC